MKRNQKINKILIVFCIFLLICLNFFQVKATYCDDILEKNELYNKIITYVRSAWQGDKSVRILFKNEDGSYSSVCTPEYSTVSFNNDNYLCIAATGDVRYVQYCVYNFDSDGNYLNHSLNRIDGNNSFVFDTFRPANYYYSDSEIMDGNNKLVNPSLTPLARTFLVEVQKQEIIKEIVGILPLIIVVVVSFLGLRKALTMLVTFLRRS